MTRGFAGIAAFAGILLGAAATGAADLPDFERGKALYENHCIVCHSSKVHRRNPPSAIDREALQFIVRVWVEEQNLRWTQDDIRDVVEYLNRTYYRYDR